MSSPPASDRIPPPAALVADRYEVRREIGRGASGRVAAAWDHQLGREVALKILDPRVAEDPELITRFDSEIRTTARLVHPGVVAVHEACTMPDGARCYVMSLARGRTLEAKLDELRQSADHWQAFPLIDRLTLFLRLLDIIAFAHSRDVVHRDLKPANIMVGDYGELWVLDWGLARTLRSESAAERTYDELFDDRDLPVSRPEAATVIMQPQAAAAAQPAAAVATGRSERVRSERIRTGPQQVRSTHFGQIMGSPAYMSPEQARGHAGQADARSDIYSLGCILVELLTLRTPCELGEGETVVELIQRVKDGERRTLEQLWPDCPPALRVVSEWALQREVQDRYPEVASFAQDLRTLLSQLSASYAENERQRLAREREGAWLPAGSWDFAASVDPGPFTIASTAMDAEVVGQVAHPELGGILLGGYGLQIYPLATTPGEDVRLTMTMDLRKGSEVWIFVRGIPPAQSYQFRLGAYGGRWLAICRGEGRRRTITGEFLTLMPIARHGSTDIRRADTRPRTVVVEAVGSHLTFSLDGCEPLRLHDIYPVSSDGGIHLGIGTWHSQVLIHRLAVERRASPLMVPSYAIGNELLRRGQERSAIGVYRRFLAEHPDGGAAIEARYMLCLALIQAGEGEQAEQGLRDFLADHLDHALARDAIFELARMRLGGEQGLVRALREIMAWQEADDLVRTRFAIWVTGLLEEQISARGLERATEAGLEALRAFVRGSPDEHELIGTLVAVASIGIRRYANRLLDREDRAGLAALHEAEVRLRRNDLPLPMRHQRLHEEYVQLAREIGAGSDPARTVMLIGRGDGMAFMQSDFVRDCLALAALGCGEQLLAALGGDDVTPVERILRASLLLRQGEEADARADLEACFRLTDILETERTSLSVLFAARLGCFGLGYLPWELVADGLKAASESNLAVPLKALAAWLAENLGHRDAAAALYRDLAAEGSGYVLIGRMGLDRLEA